MRQPGGLHDFGDTSSVEATLAKQPRGLPQDILMLLGRLAGGIAHCFGLPSPVLESSIASLDTKYDGYHIWASIKYDDHHI